MALVRVGTYNEFFKAVAKSKKEEAAEMLGITLPTLEKAIEHPDNQLSVYREGRKYTLFLAQPVTDPKPKRTTN